MPVEFNSDNSQYVLDIEEKTRNEISNEIDNEIDDILNIHTISIYDEDEELKLTNLYWLDKFKNLKILEITQCNMYDEDMIVNFIDLELSKLIFLDIIIIIIYMYFLSI